MSDIGDPSANDDVCSCSDSDVTSIADSESIRIERKNIFHFQLNIFVKHF